VQIASSNSDEFALLSNGRVYEWGLGEDGELGNGSRSDSLTKPVRVAFPVGVSIAFLAKDAMPYNTSLAVDTNGNAWGWGDNSYGSLCLGDTLPRIRPVELPFNHVTAVAGAGDHALYDADGTVYACGTNHSGDLGIGSTKHSFVPAKVSALPVGQVTELVASSTNSGALLSDGTYFDWGFNGSGQLGDGESGTFSTTPVRVTLPADVADAAQGGSSYSNGQTLVTLTNGSVWTWGNDTWGQLGDGGDVAQPSPIPLVPPAGVAYVEVATGGATSYGVTASGDVYAWGCNTRGEIGNGTVGTDVLSPVKVESDVTSISTTANTVLTR
jgi:alpha-tubulin suppressor-like RCC1 family protein